MEPVGIANGVIAGLGLLTEQVNALLRVWQDEIQTGALQTTTEAVQWAKKLEHLVLEQKSIDPALVKSVRQLVESVQRLQSLSQAQLSKGDHRKALEKTNSDKWFHWPRSLSAERRKRALLSRTPSPELDKSQRRSGSKRKDSDDEGLFQEHIHEGLGFTVLCIKTLTDICVLWSKFNGEAYTQSNM